MFLKNFDFLSPKITLYYKGSLSHESWMSGLISLFSVILLILLGIYYSLDLIKRQNPKAFFFNRYVEDSGIYPVNSSSLFHYISMSNINELYDEMAFDFHTFRIIGIDIYYQNYVDDKNKSIYNYNHWLYGYCNNDTDTQGIGYLITQKYFTNFGCIRKYYDSKIGKYFNVGEDNFKWPIMAHGLSNPNKQYYSILIENCQQETLNAIFGEGHKCKNDSENAEIFKGYNAFRFNIIDQFADVLKYKDPHTKYITLIESTIAKDNYSVNHINFNPSIVYTHDGVILDNTKEERSYTFERNDALVYYEKDTSIYSVYNFWLKNRLQCYDRTYKKIQDVISDIGGVSEAITVVVAFFNCFFNKYATMMNIEKVISPYLKDNNDKVKKHKIELSNLETNKLNKTDIGKNSSLSQTNNEITEKKDDFSKNSNNDNAYIENSYKYQNTQIINKNNDISNLNKNSFDFWSFRIYKLTCGKKNNYFKLYEDFRIKIISEEHIIKSHINQCNLLKINEINEIEKKSYLLQDLVDKG